MVGTARRAYRLEDDIIHMLEALSYLHGGNATDALREAVRRYYEHEGAKVAEIADRLREIERIAAGDEADSQDS